MHPVIGILGGTDWTSTRTYYRLFGRLGAERDGGPESARLLVSARELDAVVALQRNGEWDAAGDVLATEAVRLERAGADVIVLTSSTLHHVAKSISDALTTARFVHIIDAICGVVGPDGHRTLGVFGCSTAMGKDGYYAEALSSRGFNVTVPLATDADLVQRAIAAEMRHSEPEPSSRRACRWVIADLAMRGATCVLLGCADVRLRIAPDDPGLAIPAFDAMAEHARAALAVASSGHHRLVDR